MPRSVGYAALLRFIEAFDGDLDQRAVGDHRVDVCPLPGARDMHEDGAAFGLAGDDACCRGEVGNDALLQVEREPRIRFQVVEPGSLRSALGWPLM